MQKLPERHTDTQIRGHTYAISLVTQIIFRPLPRESETLFFSSYVPLSDAVMNALYTQQSAPAENTFPSEIPPQNGVLAALFAVISEIKGSAVNAIEGNLPAYAAVIAGCWPLEISSRMEEGMEDGGGRDNPFVILAHHITVHLLVAF